MKQVRHYLRDGSLDIGEIPLPMVGSGDVLVRNHFSFVSVGTERMKVAQARMSLLEKARARPDQVRLVLDTFREQGLAATLRKVRERLRAPSTLGYSCAGTVVAVGSQVEEFRVGERVACIGEGFATHAEYNLVPRNLLAPVPAGVSLDVASASAVGAIALQTIRQARLELGESVAIIGSGCSVNSLVQLCRANGCRVIGIDLDPGKCAGDGERRRGLRAAQGRGAAARAARERRRRRRRGADHRLERRSRPDRARCGAGRDHGRVVCPGNTAIELEWRTVRQGDRISSAARWGPASTSPTISCAAGTTRSATYAGRPTATCAHSSTSTRRASWRCRG
jgi:polar amino acid transport system substrate-binding protein